MVLIPKKNATAKRLAFVNILAGFILFAAGTLTDKSWLGQCIGLVLIVCGIQFLVRFVLSDYRYIIDSDDGGDVCLIICKKTGSKDVKLGHISLFCVNEVVPREKKTTKAGRTYNYCQNFGVKGTSVIYQDGDELCEIIIEADASFVSELKRRAGEGDGGTVFAM